MVQTIARPIGDLFGPFYNIKFFTAAETAPGLIPDSPIKTSALELILDQVYKNDMETFKKDQAVLDSYQLEKYVSNLTIEARMASMFDFTLTLTPPLEVGLDIIDKRLLKFDSVIQIQWGYAGAGGIQTSNIYYMKLVKPGFSFAESITFTLRGFEFYSHGMRIATNKDMFKRDKYHTDYAVLTALATELGCTLNVVGISTLHPLYAVKKEPVADSGNNWSTFKNIIRDNQLTFTTLEKNIIKIYQPENFLLEKSSYNLKYYSDLTSDKDIPLMSFEANADQDLRAFLGGEHKSLFYTEIDTDSHKVVSKKLTGQTITNNSVKGDAFSVNNATEPAVKQIIKVGQDIVKAYADYSIKEHGSYVTMPNGANNNESKATQHVKEASYQVNTKAKVRFPGVPDFMPFMNVNVFGVGEALGGTYLVESARHEIGLNGYETTADLLKLSTSDSLSRGARNLGPTIPDAAGSTPDKPLSPDNTKKAS